MARHESPRSCRRALAELSGNYYYNNNNNGSDSPICGLIPSSEPRSHSTLKTTSLSGSTGALPSPIGENLLRSQAQFLLLNRLDPDARLPKLLADPHTSTSSGPLAACSTEITTDSSHLHESDSIAAASACLSPVGENLLRSQVQLLLHKIESDAPPCNLLSMNPPPSLSCLHNLPTCSVSPALRLVAPTPMNSPLAPGFSSPSAASMSIPEISKHLCAVDSPTMERRGTREAFLDAGIELFVDLTISPQAAPLSRGSIYMNDQEVEASGFSSRKTTPVRMKHSTPIRIAESVTSGQDHHHHVLQLTPLISTHEDKARAFPGKSTTRILRFDSPDKSSSCWTLDDAIRYRAEGLEEDDRESEWSVVVNISSPNAYDEECFYENCVEEKPNEGDDEVVSELSDSHLA